jgi:ankyrin repeat protein
VANHLIFYHVFHGNSRRVKEFLASDPSLLSARTAVGLTPLHVAASRGQSEVVSILLDAGADISGPSPGEQWTPLVWAAYRGHTDTVALLLKRGADPTARGGNPIHFAAQRRHREICQLLVEHGAADDLVASGERQALALFRAVLAGDVAATQAVLAERPALARTKARNGRTALHEAALGGDPRLVEVLLAAGADPTARDRRGQMPLDVAVVHRQRAAAALLQEAKGRGSAAAKPAPRPSTMPQGRRAAWSQLLDAIAAGNRATVDLLTARDPTLVDARTRSCGTSGTVRTGGATR